MAEVITLNGIDIEFDEDVFKSIPQAALEELIGGTGDDTPAVVMSDDVTRMTREGHIMSDLTNWYSIAHRKWNSRAGNKITKITIHHMAGNLSKRQMESCVYNPNRQMSCNYAVYSDGTVECFVGEQFRSWCSSSWDNDKNAVTIETANDTLAPNWTVSKEAYETLIKLCADICKRNGITPKYTGKASGTLTVHRMFSNTACPGPYLLKLHQNGTIEKDIIAAMNPEPKPEPKPAPAKVLYKVQCGAFKQKVNAVNLQQKLKAAGFTSILKAGDGYTKVQVGAYAVKANAEAQLAKLKKAGFGGVIVEVKQ